MNRHKLSVKLYDRKITQDDVAWAAGVTQSAVSRWFSNGYVSEELSARIAPVVESLAKQPAAAVRGNKRAALAAAEVG